MSEQRRISLNLAHAILAGAEDFAVMQAAARRLFGQAWEWCPPLLYALLERTAGSLHAYRVDELADLIDVHPAYAKIWQGNGPKPRIDRYPLAPALHEPRPYWVPHDLPQWRSLVQLADWLDIERGELEWFAGLRRDSAAHFRHYFYRPLAKRHGGIRLIEIPKGRLREIQRRLLHGFIEHIPLHGAAQGFRRGYSCRDHALAHQGRQVVVRMDLQDFFNSIPAARIHALFTTLGHPPEVARILTGLCTHRVPWSELSRREYRDHLPFAQRRQLAGPHLPQGAPTSPALANLCAFRLDIRLAALAEKLGANYTRYADDLAFSGDAAFAAEVRRFPALVGAIALEEDFQVNYRKTRIMPAGQRQEVTGLIVNHHANVPRSTYDELKAILHNCVKYGPQSQNRMGRGDFRAHLLGRIAWIATLNPTRGQKLRQTIEQIAWD